MHDSIQNTGQPVLACTAD